VPFVSVNNLRFYYEMYGPVSSPVLVFSHSLGTNVRMWDPQMPKFGQSFRVLRYDMRGHGQSGVSPGPYSIDQLADDVIALLDALSIPTVYFCGLSIGGLLGLSLGLRAPKRLRRIVLCDTAAKIGTAETWDARIATVQKGGMAAVTEAVLERWYTPQFRQSAPKAIAQTREMLLTTPAEGYIATCAALRDADLRGAIRQIKLPTLVIGGTYDPAIPPGESKAIADAIAGAKYVELPAAHLSNIEAAEQFTACVDDFLRE
jgi:3-oxoadipate enol-lactonase